MKKDDGLAQIFQERRTQLRAVAYRLLGSTSEAEDALQETWLRLSRSDSERIENLGGWLTTVVSRVCLDMLRSRKSKREEVLEPAAQADSDRAEAKSPEIDLMLADSVGSALLVVLDSLTPLERIAFVLHDLFDLPFQEIASILDGTEDSAKQLASRARRKLRGEKETLGFEAAREKEIVTAFLAASREGDFSALLKLLAPDVVLRADETAVRVAASNRSKGAPPFENEIHGARKVAETFRGRATAAQIAFIDGHAGAAWAPGGNPVVTFLFRLVNDKVASIEVVMDPERLKKLDIRIPSQEGDTK